jgi:hypothetical protein
MNSLPSRTVLIHYHIFKNAGTTVESVLHENFGSRFSRFDGTEYSAVLTNETFLTFLNDHPSICASSSHHLRPPKPVVDRIAFHDLVLLRHPIDRLASTYDFYHRSQIEGDPLGSWARHLDLAPFLVCLIEKFPHLVNNAQVNYVNGGNKIPREPDLKRALERMEQFSVLGVTELFDLCMISAEYLLERDFGNLDFSYVPQNVSPGRLRGLSERLENIKEACGAQFYERLVKLNRLDLELFAAATREAQRKYQQIPDLRERMNDFAGRCKMRASNCYPQPKR